MRNLVECNIMIPKIIIIHDEREGEKAIQHIITENRISPSHVLILKPDKEELHIDQVRQMQKDVQVSFSKQLLVVLYSLDDSGVEVQNSLLKILEEESHRLLFILLVKTVSRLLPTIISRCSIMPHAALLSINPEVKGIANFAEFFSFQKNSESTKDDALAKIDTFLLSHAVKSRTQLRFLLTHRNLILDNNMNPILALDSILLFLLKPSSMKVLNEKKK